MTTLLELKEKLTRFYGKYDIYITPVIKFTVALTAFLLINHNIGYMEKISSTPIALILALICSILPVGGAVFIGSVLILSLIHIYFAEQMIIEFDEGRMVEYPYKLLDELELAYAITIHKSQGSEYPAVVIPLLGGPMMLMNRNLLYTAVTRARKCVTLVGNEVTFQQMIRNTSQQKRYSGLCDRLKEN